MVAWYVFSSGRGVHFNAAMVSYSGPFRARNERRDQEAAPDIAAGIKGLDALAARLPSER